ncbi:MAG: hypothetical protein HFI38_12425 [Lachnospiraceae bacterium]|jgi:glycerophosphoryl diester phosphodiesterase|nr:hypothetical protein [Lachnospiraceae bacterium]
MKIWAHRGCSQRYPENTQIAFEKAMELVDLEGIELDVQLTRDGELVVIHDERVDRTTEGIGYVREYSLIELKRLHIYADMKPSQSVLTMEETLDLLKQRLKTGMKLNIELKTGVYPYPGIEKKLLELIHRKCTSEIEGHIIYSSFYALSLERIRELDPEAQIGILDERVSDCLFKLKGCQANALHPFWKGMDLPEKRLEGYTVRAWLTGHLYPEKSTGGRLDLKALKRQGITDVFLNEPEEYL